jgi:beta-galactosidase
MLPEAPGLAVIGDEAKVSGDALRAYAEKGGRLLVLARGGDGGPLGVPYSAGKSAGSLTVPAWPEAAGLSASDLRLRNVADVNVIRSGGEIAAEGFLSRMPIGRGVAVFAQIDPSIDADNKTYFRLSRWRQTRILSQLLANLGGEFSGDLRIFKPVDGTELSVPLAGAWRAKSVKRIDDPDGVVHPDPGMSPEAQALLAADTADADWAEVKAPGALEDNGPPWAAANGETVVRMTIDVPAALASQELVLELTAVDDFDVTHVNGQRVGGSPDVKTSQWDVQRQYKLPPGLITAGRNVIAVRLWDQFGGGGFNGPATKIKLAPVPQDDAAARYHRDHRADFEMGR